MPELKPLIVKNYMAIEPEIMVCKKCNQPVRNGWGDYYACDACKSLTSNVEWRKQRTIS
jgi:Zn finger protein HypA/HybF involved in hydrogenase expression